MLRKEQVEDIDIHVSKQPHGLALCIVTVTVANVSESQQKTEPDPFMDEWAAQTLAQEVKPDVECEARQKLSDEAPHLNHSIWYKLNVVTS